jgi:hypothetical protein
MKRIMLAVAILLLLPACSENDPVAPSDLQPQFARQPRLPHSYTFEKGIPSEWTLQGNANWSVSNVDPLSRRYSAISGDIGDGQFSEMILNVTCGEGAQVSFLWKVDSEASYDWLRLVVNGSWVWSKSGVDASGGDPEIVALPVGAFYVVFAYQKDADLSYGSDAAWIDDVQLKGCTLTPAT